MFAEALTKGKPERVRFNTTQGIAEMSIYYNGKGLIGNSNVLAMVLGRKPPGYKERVQLAIKESNGEAGLPKMAAAAMSEPEMNRCTANGLR